MAEQTDECHGTDLCAVEQIEELIAASVACGTRDQEAISWLTPCITDLTVGEEAQREMAGLSAAHVGGPPPWHPDSLRGAR